MMYLFLIGAILCEVAGTLSLRLAVTSSRWWYLAVAAGYLAAFCFLLLTLRADMPLGVAYGVWAASGVALTAIASKYLFGEALNRRMISGILLIIGGVLLVELGAAH
ncbi:SMR family transporter [Gordonia sp. CPCC 205515]|uniref:DMT family transporter n=1 Tax=Gordonia sp. CPCC 205515 TaxID=3140791 RepID=UPI003AF3D8A6